MAWVDEGFKNCGLSRPSTEDFRRIAIRRMVHREYSSTNAGDLIRFLTWFACTSDMAGGVWGLPSGYRYDDVAMDGRMGTPIQCPELFGY